MDEKLMQLTTESRNNRTMQIDTADTKDILTIMNEEDHRVAEAVKAVLPEIEQVVSFVLHSFQNGGRLFYMGAGTSGRLGVLDAVECPPTFSTPPEMVQGLIAGGERAFVKAVEGAEDDEAAGRLDLESRGLTEQDTVIGLAASGRTPYVKGALAYAQEIGAKTAAISCNHHAPISAYADQPIEVVVGPEVLTGSTRLKAATAQKMILNMISTASMLKMGKAFENLMVDVHVSNVKLKQRAIHTIVRVTGVSKKEAEAALHSASNEVKPAIVMLQCGLSFEEAKKLLAEAKGYVRKAVQLGREREENSR
ncbi:N-acetylmuramic acid 6-phosphate etherase [Domibacillus robiginosus]|uniref:N-acetylmuramic acid 6-phosphate etherase n=1 Tax=Domibacillus robiginosus TaxID=1071054 RepID=UPI00067CF158|nr:N-acetylmuramic acid 6-phosphate etherase [Domibacillus robiginosus]